MHFFFENKEQIKSRFHINFQSIDLENYRYDFKIKKSLIMLSCFYIFAPNFEP